MLKRVIHSLGLVEHSNENPRRKNKVKRKHHHQDKTKENIKLSTPNAVNILLPANECRINEKGGVKETNRVGQEKVNAKVDMFQGGDDADESCFTANEFYVSKDKSARCSRRKGIVKGKKPFVAPFPMARLYRDLGWKPSLATVDDLSP
ncbi:unnamed protein product [Vicia faba]|uniref:Uncharacterized protein n=1 Tax=Vicia faba TaxID=3906 RepID=A0AAV0YQQ0_VICFA|nr:unnamed protein product [Vicia faba]